MSGKRYAIEVGCEFCAAHAIVIGGVRERVHGHNWRVLVVLGGDALDGDGLLLDFHAAEGALRGLVKEFENGDLNACAALSGVNPTAERVAEFIGEGMSRWLAGSGATGVVVESVRVTEAPGCAAWYRPGGAG
ncbi:MAG: 6-pyruvoyl trahydropterin synthase family protein [Phycisphaerales bacterium]